MYRVMTTILATVLILAGCENKQSSSQQVASNIPFHLVLVPQIKLNNQNRSVVYGTTNLPDNTILSTTISNETISSMARAEAIVKNGEFQTLSFGPESGYVAGVYEVSVQLVADEEQPDGVQRVLGAKGEMLTGPLIEPDTWDGKVAIATMLFQVGTPDEITAANASYAQGLNDLKTSISDLLATGRNMERLRQSTNLHERSACISQLQALAPQADALRSRVLTVDGAVGFDLMMAWAEARSCIVCTSGPSAISSCTKGQSDLEKIAIGENGGKPA